MVIKYAVELVNCSVFKKSSILICTGMERWAQTAVGRNFRPVSAVSCDWPLQHYKWTLIGKADITV